MQKGEIMKLQFWKELIEIYDKSFLSGLKNYLTIAVIFAAIFFMPEGKLSYFVSALGLVHLFVLRVAK